MIRPLRDRLLVKLLPRYDSNLPITLVDNKRHYEGTRRGEVKFIGPLVKEIAVGDNVIFGGDAGESFGFDSAGSLNDGIEWRQLRAKDILAVVEIQEVTA